MAILISIYIRNEFYTSAYYDYIMNYVALVQLNAAEYDDSNTLEMKRNSMDGWHEHKADLSFLFN